MEVILRLISELRYVLVAMAGIGAAAFIFTGLGLMREMRRAMFRLERSAITGRVISSWLKAGLCVIVGAGIWAASATPQRPTASASTNLLSATPTVTLIAATPVPTADLSQAQAVMTSAPLSDSLASASASITNSTAISAPQPAETASVPLTAAPVAPVVPATPTPLVLPTVAPLPSATSAPAATLPTLPTLPPATAGPASKSTKQPASTQSPTPTSAVVAAPAASAAPSLAANCPNPDAQIFSPSAGETVSGGYIIRGTAGFNQGKYKIEILRPNIQGWAFLWEGFNSVKAEVLMPNFNSHLFTPGIYTLRLMLVDVAGQETSVTCTVPIRIA